MHFRCQNLAGLVIVTVMILVGDDDSDGSA